MNKRTNKNTSTSNYVWLQLYYRILRFIENLKCNTQVVKAIFVIALTSLVFDQLINHTYANDAFVFLLKKVGVSVFFTVGCLLIVLKYSDAFFERKYYEAFISIGFMNSIGIPPILIKRIKTTNTLTLIFDNVGIALINLENRKNEIESILNISIASISIGENNRQIVVKAGIGKFRHDKTLYWNSNNFNNQNDSLLLGESMFNPISVSLNNYPHILIGGATGSGKTLLLKLMLMQCINNGFTVNIIDFKGGIDFGQIWRQHCIFITDIEKVTEKLDEILVELEYRKRIYLQKGYKNISDYNSHEFNKQKRIIIACDELAELLDTTGLATKEKEPIKKIQNQLSSLARLGRAFGIHLILSTQRPDANIITGQIKNNISYKICGRADQVLSQIILDNTDAATYIPSDSKGLFLNQDGILFKAYLFDEYTDIKGGGLMQTEQ